MIEKELNIFLYAILIGIIFGAIYGFIMIIRKNLKLKNKTIDYIYGLIEDIIFMIFLYNSLYNYVLVFNEGVMRLYIFLGIIIGVIFFFVLLYRVLDNIFKFFKNIILEISLKIKKSVNVVLKKLITIFSKFKIHKKVYNNKKEI